MVYMGRGLRAATGSPEPALLDPALQVDRRDPDWAGQGLDYWPSYDSIPPASRAAYLTWLAGGRSHPSVPIGYVFLFFYGLERLALVDAAQHPALRAEIPAVKAEVRRLLGLYGSHRSFDSYAGQFLDLLELVDLAGTDTTNGAPPVCGADRWRVPAMLRVGLGQFARDGQPVPADWALAWAWHHPDIHPRTPQTRCREEYDALFCLRYHERHPQGIRLRDGRTRIAVDYNSASAGIYTAHVEIPEVPDVLEQAAPSRKLADVVTTVTDELDTYSRWLGRHPEGRGTLAAAALLPAELFNNAGGEVDALRGWAEQRLAGQDSALIEATEVIGKWPTASPEKMTRAEAVSFAQMLGRFGIGVEPDVRLGGPALASGSVVLFRTGPDAPLAATPAYTAATTLLHLAVAVGAADGGVSEVEHNHLVPHLESALHLTVPERSRLQVHLRWLVASGAKLTGLKKRLEMLDEPQRAAVGDFLITVAAADGVVSPDEVKTLTKIYKLLGLDPESVYNRLHQQLTTGNHQPSRPAPATGPVTVRPATREPGGFAIPTTPPTPPDRSPGKSEIGTPPHEEPVAAGSPAATVVLDEEAIAAKLAETAQVSALLAGIFTEDDDPPRDGGGPADPGNGISGSATDEPTDVEVLAEGDPVGGLDAAHSGLLRALAAQPRWTQAEYEVLAQRFGVLPAGALDVLNEAALEACGEPVAEGDEDIEINDYALQELLG
jgi:uncharacterized tellurite resistance protein B-like protein